MSVRPDVGETSVLDGFNRQLDPRVPRQRHPDQFLSKFTADTPTAQAAFYNDSS